MFNRQNPLIIIVFLRIRLEWKKFDLEYSRDCTKDYVLLVEPVGTGENTLNEIPSLNNTSTETGKYEKFCGNFSGQNLTL